MTTNTTTHPDTTHRQAGDKVQVTSQLSLDDYQPALSLEFSKHALWTFVEQQRNTIVALTNRVGALETRLGDLEAEVRGEHDDRLTWLEDVVYGDNCDNCDDDHHHHHPTPSPCIDCGTDTTPDTAPGSRDTEYYMVAGVVWAAAGMKVEDPNYNNEFLCIPCLEGRLGRPLTGADFPADIPINQPGARDDTDRLAQLKREAVELATPA